MTHYHIEQEKGQLGAAPLRQRSIDSFDPYLAAQRRVDCDKGEAQ